MNVDEELDKKLVSKNMRKYLLQHMISHIKIETTIAQSTQPDKIFML